MPDAAEILKCRILVAEDEPSLRKLLTTALRRRQLDVTAVVNGAEAIDELQRNHFHVAVLDLMMPTTSGWDVIAWLARNRDRAPASVMVVSAADRAILRDLDPGVVNAIIFKPFDVFQLTSYVKASCTLTKGDRRKARRVGE